jgi:MFS family permease
MRYGAMLKLPNLWIGALSYFFTSVMAYIMLTFIVTYGSMELKFPYAQAAGLASIIAFSGIIGTLFIPILSDSLGRKKCQILTNLLIAFSIILVTRAGDNWTVLIVTVFIFGVFLAATWPMYAAAAGDFFPRGITGSVLGFWTIFYGTGAILAPPLGGYIADRTGTFTWSFLLAAVSAALSTVFFAALKKPRDAAPVKNL